MHADKKAAIEKAMVMGLLAVFGLTLARGPLMKALRPPAPVLAALPTVPISLGPPAGEGTAAAQAASSTTKGASSASRKYAAQDFRDPFESQLPGERPAPETGAVAMAPNNEPAAAPTPGMVMRPPSSLQVQGVLWGGSNPKALINGSVYGVNDIVQGSKIIAIDHRGVVIDDAGSLVYYAPDSPPQAIGGDMRPQYAR